jgi:hypothetical protein
MNNLVTITIVGLVAGTIITITAPPGAAVVMVLGIGAICVFGYVALQKGA